LLIDAFYVIAENTPKVARNLNYRSKQSDSSAANYVDVLIPEVIQVVASLESLHRV